MERERSGEAFCCFLIKQYLLNVMNDRFTGKEFVQAAVKLEPEKTSRLKHFQAIHPHTKTEPDSNVFVSRNFCEDFIITTFWVDFCRFSVVP